MTEVRPRMSATIDDACLLEMLQRHLETMKISGRKGKVTAGV
jgi:hypothetical protein